MSPTTPPQQDTVNTFPIRGMGLYCEVHRVDTQLLMAEMADLQVCTWKLI